MSKRKQKLIFLTINVLEGKEKQKDKEIHNKLAKPT